MTMEDFRSDFFQNANSMYLYQSPASTIEMHNSYIPEVVLTIATGQC